MEEELKPKYGLTTTVTMVIGAVIGVGIFLRAPQMALSAGGDVKAVMLSWVIAAFMIIPIAVIICEIASMCNKSGGIQIYAEETWNKRFGFTIGWAQSFFYIPANLVFMLYLTGEYTLKVIKQEQLGLSGIVFYAFIYATLLFAVNITSGHLGGFLQNIATFIKIIPLVLIGLAGSFYWGEKLSTLGSDPLIIEEFTKNSSLPFYIKVASLIPAGLFAFDGWIFVGVVSREVKNPERNLPLAIIGSLLFIAILYLVFSFASFNVADSASLATGGVNNTHLALLLFGPFFANILNLFVLISALGVANANILAIIRAPYALSKGRAFLGSAFLSKVNEKRGIPLNSGLTAFFVVLLWLFIPYFLGLARNGKIYAMFIDSSLLLFFGFFWTICLGVIKMRVKTTKKAPFRVPFIWLFMILATIGAFYSIFSLAVAYSNLIFAVCCYILASLSGYVFYSFVRELKN